MVVIGLVIALIGFAIMSRPFKIGFGLYLAFLAYYIYLYGGKGGGVEEASTAFSLVSGAVALLVRQLQVRKSSSTARRLLR